MPHDLFGDVVARPSSVRSRRSSLVVASLLAHAALLLFGVVAAVVAPDALPFPQKALAYFEPLPVRLVDIELPKRPAAATARKSDPASAAVPEPPLVAAPIVAPIGIRPETGFEGLRMSTQGSVESVPQDGTPIDVLTGHLAFPTPPRPAPPAVRLHAGIRAPRKIADALPVYPALARAIHIEGVVILEATIGASGAVESVRVLRSIPLLDQAAIDAVHQWRYEPARLNDEPVAVIVTITLRFTLTP